MSKARHGTNDTHSDADDGLSEEALEPFRSLADDLEEGDPIGDFCRAVVENHSSDNREAN